LDAEQNYMDYKDIFKMLRKRKYLSLFIIIITLIVAYMYRTQWSGPVYETRVSLIIGSPLRNDQSQFQIQDINTVKESMQTYIMILKTNAVAETTIKKLGLDMSPDDLKKHLEAEPQPQTSLMEIRLKWNDKDQALHILKTIVDIFIREATQIYPAYRIKVMEAVEPYKIEVLSDKLYYLAALFGSLMIALFVVLLVELFDNTIRTEEDIEKYLGIPVVGKIPKQKNIDINVLDSGKIARSGKRSSPHSYRILRANLFYLSEKSNTQTILVTSARPKEGKSTSASILAAVLAQDGELTLLIDCDFIKPSLHEIFNTSIYGLFNILKGECSWEDCISESSLDNLYILPAGISVFDPVELISSHAMKNLILELREAFDFIIIDTPHIEMATEAQALFQYSDGYLIVVAASKSNRDTVRRSLRLARYIDERILGALINKVPNEKRFRERTLSAEKTSFR
jgi:succinoglycan biosynthesis transport protein ExoP